MEEKYEQSDDGEDFELFDDSIREDNSFAKVRAHSKDVFCLAISPDKRWIASGSEDDTAAIWDLQQQCKYLSVSLSSTDNEEEVLTNPEPHHRINSHIDSVNLLAWNASGNTLASADMAGRIICTSVPILDESTSLIIDDCAIEPVRQNDEEESDGEENGRGFIEQICWICWHSAAEGILFVGSKDGQIWMWLVVRRNDRAHLSVHQSKLFTTNSSAPCCAAKLLSDTKFLFAVYENCIARLWNLKEATSVEVVLSTSCSGAMDMNSDLTLAAIGGQNGRTDLVSLHQNSKLLHTFNSPKSDEQTLSEDSVESVCFATNGLPWLAVGTAAGHLSIFDVEKHSSRYECDHDGEAVVSCIWLAGPNNSFALVSACSDSAIRFWDAKSGDPLGIMLGSGDGIFYLSVLESDEDGQIYLFSACANGLIRVFRVEANIFVAKNGQNEFIEM